MITDIFYTSTPPTCQAAFLGLAWMMYRKER